MNSVIAEANNSDESVSVSQNVQVSLMESLNSDWHGEGKLVVSSVQELKLEASDFIYLREEPFLNHYNLLEQLG